VYDLQKDLTFDCVLGRRKAWKGCALNTRKADSLIALFARESEGTVKRLVARNVIRR
jgi:hypothetical protein